MVSSVRELMMQANSIQNALRKAFPIKECHAVLCQDDEGAPVYKITVKDKVYTHGEWVTIEATTTYFPHLPIPTHMEFLEPEVVELGIKLEQIREGILAND